LGDNERKQEHSKAQDVQESQKLGGVDKKRKTKGKKARKNGLKRKKKKVSGNTQKGIRKQPDGGGGVGLEGF